MVVLLGEDVSLTMFNIVMLGHLLVVREVISQPSNLVLHLALILVILKTIFVTPIMLPVVDQLHM
jgi:hypothetical protein